MVTYLDRVDDALLDGLPSVRQVSSYGVGVNHVDLPAMARRGIVVTNTPDVLTDATADMAMALLLAAARRVCEGDRLIRAGGWRDAGPEFLLGREVTGKTLGIVGFGRIGQAMARRASGFGMRILYTSPRDAGVPGATRTDLDVLLASSDFVSLHCPLTDATRDLLSRERIARMKPGAILVNTSRGPVVDEEALADALEDGRLFAAGPRRLPGRAAGPRPAARAPRTPSSRPTWVPGRSRPAPPWPGWSGTRSCAASPGDHRPTASWYDAPVKRFLQIAGGLAISGLALWLTLRGKDLGAIWAGRRRRPTTSGSSPYVGILAAHPPGPHRCAGASCSSRWPRSRSRGSTPSRRSASWRS